MGWGHCRSQGVWAKFRSGGIRVESHVTGMGQPRDGRSTPESRGRGGGESGGNVLEGEVDVDRNESPLSLSGPGLGHGEAVAVVQAQIRVRAGETSIHGKRAFGAPGSKGAKYRLGPWADHRGLNRKQFLVFLGPTSSCA